MPLGSSLRMAFSPDTAPKHADRRQSPRYDMSGTVFLIADGMDATRVGMVRDMSLNGAFVVSQEDIPSETLLKWQFRVGADFEMSGYVCRKDRNGFAVNFKEEA